MQSSSTGSAAISVHIVHADPLMAAGLLAVLSDYADLLVSCHDASHTAPRQAGVTIADYRRGMALARAAGRHAGAPRVLVVASLDREWELRSAMESGVQGYLLQDCSTAELIAAVRVVGKGARYLSQAVSRRVTDSLGRASLTGRETEVLQLLAKGCCNKTIARELGIGVGTVKTHVKGLMNKLDATARTHAVAVATQRGMLGGVLDAVASAVAPR